jgi:hypothetical protein
MSALLLLGARYQVLNARGVVPGARVYVYLAGGLTPAPTWQNQAQTLTNAFPVVCDDYGQCDIWTNPVPVRVIAKTPGGVTIYDRDNLTSPATLEGSLAAPGGANLVGFLQFGAGAVARTLQAKGREILSVTDFGAVGDGVTNDTAAITAAYASAKATGKELVFPPGVWAVTTISFDGGAVFVRFAGNSRLKGIASVATPAVLEITGLLLRIYGLQVDGNYNTNYTKGAVWWRSVDPANPAQFNTVFGMRLVNCKNGLVFGDVIGGSPVNAPQSENTIYSLTTRACQVPFLGNQPNGFLTLIAPVLDCTAYEWAGQPGYDATAWNTAARCFDNRASGSNHLTIVGGEIIKTSSTLGYGMYGGTVALVGPNVIEIACTQAYLDGGFSVTDCANWAMTAGGVADSALPGFVIDPAASAGASFYLRNVNFFRTTPGTSSVSTASMIAAASGSPPMPITLLDSSFSEWRWDDTVPLVSGCVLAKYDNNTVTVATRGGRIPGPDSVTVGVTAATFTVLPGDTDILCNRAGTVTLTLPSAAAFPRRVLEISTITANTVVSASSNVLPLGGTLTGTAILSASSGKWATLKSDGTNWRIMRAN